MVDYIITDFNNVRGSGNIKTETPSATDFILENCDLIDGTEEGTFELTPIGIPIDSVVLAADHTSAEIYQYTNITLSATVEDERGELVEGATVSFKKDGVLLGTSVTNSSGVATYLFPCNVVGEFTFTATCKTVTSSSVTVTITKETTYITLHTSASTITDTDPLTLSGTLYDSNQRPITSQSGMTVKLYHNTYVIATVTTDEDGDFTHTITNLPAGSHNFHSGFDGDDRWKSAASSVKTVTVTSSAVVDSVTLATDKSVLSYYDTESAVISATVKDTNNVVVEGATVVFKKDNVVVGSSNTNSSGVASYTYASQSAGDIIFSATCEGVDSTTPLTIEDCIYAELEQIDKIRSGTTVYEALNDDVLTNLPSVYSLSFELKTSTRPSSNAEQRVYWCPTNLWTGNSQPSNAVLCGFHYYSGGTRFHFGKRLNGTTSIIDNISSSTDTWVSMEIRKVNTSGRWDFYLNGTYKDYYTVSMENYSQFKLYEIIWSNTTLSVRNVKIKVL